MNVVQIKKPFVPSLDRKALEGVLTSVEPGAIVEFGRFSDAIGRDIRTCRWLLESARRHVRREQAIVFAAVVGVGLRRLPNEEIPSRGKTYLAKARRAAGRGASEVECADYNALPEKARAEFNLSLSVSGAIALMTRPSRLKKLQDNATSAQRFAPRDAMRLFLGPKK